MNLTETLWLPVLGGVLSTLIATAFLSLLAGFRPGRRQATRTRIIVGDDHSTTIEGDHIAGDKIVNPHYEHHHHHYGDTGPRASTGNEQGGQGSDDTAGLLIGAGLACIAVVLAFLALWPYVLGLMATACVILLAAAAWLTRRSDGCTWCRKQIAPLWITVVLGIGTTVGAWLLLMRDRADGEGVRGEEHGGDIVSLVGMDSILLIGFHILALGAAAAILAMSGQDTYVLARAHWRSGTPVPPTGWKGVAPTVLIAVVAFALVGGPAEKLLDQKPQVVPQPSHEPENTHQTGGPKVRP